MVFFCFIGRIHIPRVEHQYESRNIRDRDEDSRDFDEDGDESIDQFELLVAARILMPCRSQPGRQEEMKDMDTSNMSVH